MSTPKKTTKRRRASDTPATTQTERLIRLEESMKAMDQAHAHHLSALNGTLKQIQGDIRSLGDRVTETQWGSGDKPGNLIKIDRLEQSMAQAKLMVRMMGGALATLIVGAAWTVFTGAV